MTDEPCVCDTPFTCLAKEHNVTADCDTWRRDRLAELVALDAKIDELPPVLRCLVRGQVDSLVTVIDGVNGGGHLLVTGAYVEKSTARLAAELARITVAPASEESNAPWTGCTCGHSPHMHGNGTVPPPAGARCRAAHDFDGDCPCKGYAPVSDGEVK